MSFAFVAEVPASPVVKSVLCTPEDVGCWHENKPCNVSTEKAAKLPGR